MPLFERYVLRRTARVFVFTLGGLTATLWVAQVVRELDVVTTKGQAIWVFLVMTVLALPALMQLIVPIAFAVGAVVALNGLASDSELPVISGAGASRTAVSRPILALAASLMLLLAASHHVIAPASLAALRALLMRVQTDMIAMLVQEGDFRTVADRLTMHIRAEASDGSFRDIFINDERDPNDSRQYLAATGVLLEQAGGSFLVLQNGDLISENRVKGEHSVIEFDTYALDLNQLGAPSASARYKARERSTFYLWSAAADDPAVNSQPNQVAAELHDRITAPFYILVFALFALGFLGRPRSNRQDRGLAIAAVALTCVLFRVAGFAALAAAGSIPRLIPLLYAIPASGLALGIYANLPATHLPAFASPIRDAVATTLARLSRRATPQVDVAEADSF